MFSSTSDVVISGCTFRGNTAGGARGAIESTSFSFPNIVATLFVDNTVTDGPGGAIHNAGNTAATISGCTFSANTATVGGGMANEVGGEPQIAESTFCGNAPDAIAGGYTDGGRNVFADRCPCPADTNGDGTVDVIDLVAVILDWGNDGTTRGADVVPDGVVDVLDLVAVVVAWGECD